MKTKISLKIVLGWAILSAFWTNSPAQTHSEILQETLPKRIMFENGLTLVCEKDVSSKITVVQVTIPGGKQAEPAGKSGLAYLTTRLTLEIPDQRKVQNLMDQATQFFMECGENFSFIGFSCLSKNLKESLEIASQIMLEPLFSGLRIERIKDQMNRARNIAQDESANVAYLSYLQSFFPNSAYSASLYGSEDSLKAIKKKDIEAFYQNHFRSRNLIIVVSSDLDEDTIKAMIGEHYGLIPEGPPPESPVFNKTLPEERLKTVEKDTQQTFISAGFLLPCTSPEEYVCSLMVQDHLGKGIASRLWPLRDKQKLAYIVQSRFTHLKGEGILEAYLETENAKKETALKAFQDILTAFHSQGLTQEELDTNKMFTKGSILRQNETKRERVKTMSLNETMGYGYDFFHKIFRTADAITLTEINTFIQGHLDPEKAVYVMIGPNSD